MPRPRQAGSWYERMSSPNPPPSCCTASSHATAFAIAGWKRSRPQASRAGRTAPVP